MSTLEKFSLIWNNNDNDDLNGKVLRNKLFVVKETLIV